MQRRQWKKKRPNLETAHEWLKNGYYDVITPGDSLTLAERENEINEVSKSLADLPKKFPRTQILEYAVLKSHLIVEHVITEYIRCHASVVLDFEEIRFTFSQKLEIAIYMGFGFSDPVLLPTIQLLNRARNQAAHTFLLDRTAIDELIKINSDPEHRPAKSDKLRIASLRRICEWICLYTAGRMLGEYYFDKHEQERAQ